MDELPFTPFLVGLEAWRGMFDGFAQSRGGAGASPEAAGSSAYREAFRQHGAQYREHAVQTLDAAETVRRAMFDMTAAMMTLPLAFMGGLQKAA